MAKDKRVTITGWTDNLWMAATAQELVPAGFHLPRPQRVSP